MDPAVAALDIAKAGVILANMIESYLAGGAPPSNPEGAEHDDLQDRRSTSVAGSLHLHSSIDDGAGPLQPGEHRAPVQSGEQGTVSRLELGADPDPRPGSRPVGCADSQSRGLQDASQRRGHEPSRGDLLPGSFAAGAIEPGLASPARVVRHHRHARDRRGRLLRSSRVQRRACARHEGHVRSGRAAHHPRAPPWYAVVRRFQELGLRFPRRSYGGAWDGKLIWGRLTHSRLLGILANPSYAGTYVFGRYQSCKQVGPTGEISTRARLMPRDEWRVVIPDHHPGYITWDQFLANRHRLAANRTNSEVLAGPAREGLCLLQGVLLCGICGRRLSTRYTGNGGLYPSYDCNSRSRDASPLRHCMSLPAKPLDDAIAARLLTAVTPLTIKLALEALTNLEARDKAISAQWHRRIERARYDADLAERRYEEADPSNRLVASTLEKRWNDAMQRMIELKAEVADFERQAMRSLTPEQKQQVLQLGKDFPRLWKAPTSSACDRKRMLRLLIRDVSVVKGTEPKLLHLQIRWQGGATETIDVRRQPNRAEAIRYPDTFVAKIRTMAEKYDDEEIVRRLNGEGLTSSTGKPFTVSIVRWIRFKHLIPGPSLPTGTLTVSQVRERYGVSPWVVHYWIERGVVSAVQRKPNAPYAIAIDNTVDRRLRKWVANSGHLHPSSPTQTV